jgi:hypothetical protein
MGARRAFGIQGMHHHRSQFSQKHRLSTNNFQGMKKREPSASSQKENSLKLIGENEGSKKGGSAWSRQAPFLQGVDLYPKSAAQTPAESSFVAVALPLHFASVQNF